MPPRLPIGPILVLLGVWTGVMGARAHRAHLANPAELDVGAHAASWHVVQMAMGAIIVLAGICLTIMQHRERTDERRREKLIEQRWGVG